ncbi:hypothetical protein Celaphus_00017393 [Cervus elaphus hippelaphus]|uniref:Uncharacterized protein n=1 Tax=Cervus elaphus hippelaphus TaxID=46360 RepID=A0A212D5Q8_CEREH|nr:hypothetical protein Celaphus_00017393 [Cervus elaphus hippelaphus]
MHTMHTCNLLVQVQEHRCEVGYTGVRYRNRKSKEPKKEYERVTSGDPALPQYNICASLQQEV